MPSHTRTSEWHKDTWNKEKTWSCCSLGLFWMLLSQGRSLKALVRTVLLMWSHFGSISSHRITSHSIPSHPISFAHPSSWGKGSTISHLHSPSFVSILSFLWQQECAGCMPQHAGHNYLSYPSEWCSPGHGRRMLSLAALRFPPMEFPSPWLPVWITWPEEHKQCWLHTNDCSQEEDTGILGGRAQPPAVSRRQN